MNTFDIFILYQWEGYGANKSLEQEERTEIKSLRKMVLHLEARISDKDAKHDAAKDAQVVVGVWVCVFLGVCVFTCVYLFDCLCGCVRADFRQRCQT